MDMTMWKQEQWTELSQLQKMVIVVLGIVQIALLALAQWDIHTRPEEEIRGNKWVWTAVALVNFIGPITYFILGRSRPGRKRITLAE
jgi:hypothetical protein